MHEHTQTQTYIHMDTCTRTHTFPLFTVTYPVLSGGCDTSHLNSECWCRWKYRDCTKSYEHV